MFKKSTPVIEPIIEIELKEITREKNKDQENIEAWIKGKPTPSNNNINNSSKWQPPPQQLSKPGPFLFKVLVFGDKSNNENISTKNFITRCVNDICSPQYRPNIHVNFDLDNVNLKNCQIDWQILNIADEGCKRNDAKKFTKNAHAAIITCDLSRPGFNEDIAAWNSYINVNYQPLQKILIGMTTDNDEQQLTNLQDIALKTIDKDCPAYIINLNRNHSTNKLFSVLASTLAAPLLEQFCFEAEQQAKQKNSFSPM